MSFCFLTTITICVCQSLSHVQFFEITQTVAHQAPLSKEFSRQEYWSGQPCSSPRDLPYRGIEPGSPTWQSDSLLPQPPGLLFLMGSIDNLVYATLQKEEKILSLFFFLNLLCCIRVQPISNVVIISSGKQRDSTMHVFTTAF